MTFSSGAALDMCQAPREFYPPESWQVPISQTIRHDHAWSGQCKAGAFNVLLPDGNIDNMS
eukprot:1568550-Amphidinium_carterae.7